MGKILMPYGDCFMEFDSIGEMMDYRAKEYRCGCLLMLSLPFIFYLIVCILYLFGEHELFYLVNKCIVGLWHMLVSLWHITTS